MSKVKQLLVNKYFILAAASLFWLIFDQITKYLAVAKLTMAPSYNGNCLEAMDRFMNCPHPVRLPAYKVFGDALSFVYVENPGAAFGSFGFFGPDFRRTFLLVLVFAAICLMVFVYLKTNQNQLITRICLASVIGGAIGNWIDRFRLTYVIDFISNDFGFPPFNPWPIYNVADIAVTVGVIILLIDSFLVQREETLTVENKTN